MSKYDDATVVDDVQKAFAVKAVGCRVGSADLEGLAVGLKLGCPLGCADG